MLRNENNLFQPKHKCMTITVSTKTQVHDHYHIINLFLTYNNIMEQLIVWESYVIFSVISFLFFEKGIKLGKKLEAWRSFYKKKTKTCIRFVILKTRNITKCVRILYEKIEPLQLGLFSPSFFSFSLLRMILFFFCSDVNFF